MAVHRKYKEMFTEISLSVEDWHEHVEINLGPNVGDITTEYKPPWRGRFTYNYIEAHEDSEDGALLMLRGLEPKGGLGPIVVNRHGYVTCIVS